MARRRFAKLGGLVGAKTASVAVIVQADDLLALSTIVVCPTSISTPPASFHPEVEIGKEPRTRVMCEMVGAVDARGSGISLPDSDPLSAVVLAYAQPADACGRDRPGVKGSSSAAGMASDVRHVEALRRQAAVVLLRVDPLSVD